MNREALLALLLVCLHRGDSKILRNNALMTKMMSDFRKEPEAPPMPREPEPRVLSLMQTVLCKNFRSIPCEMIMKDATLKSLIERSIQQLKYKKLHMDKTTVQPDYHITIFPPANSQEKSSYRSQNAAEHYLEKERRRRHHHPITPSTPAWSAGQVVKHKPKSSSKKILTRKNCRKFYPHKIKYKDKDEKEFKDYSGEKLSMSLEVPDMNAMKTHAHYSYKREPEDPPVWRIDYMKHGEPSLTHYEAEQLKGKLVKSGRSLVVDENELDSSRKDVLHPDVYIKKNVRKAALDLNSEGSN